MLFKGLVVSALATVSLAAPDKVQRRQAPSATLTDSGEFGLGPVGEAFATLAGVTATNEAVVSSLSSALEELYTAIAAPPPEVVEAISTAMPASVIEGYQTNPAGVFTALSGTTLPDWASSLPTEAVGYLTSQAAVVNSLFDKHGFTHTSAFVQAISSAVSELTSDLEAAPTLVPELSDDTETTATSDQVLVTGASSTGNSTLLTSTSSRSARTSNGGETTSAASTRATGASASTSPARVTSNPAARPTGALVASLAGLVGVLGVAVAL